MAPLSVACLTILCASLSSVDHEERVRQDNRRFVASVFTVDRTIGASSRDELMRPALLRTTSAGVIVVYDEHQIRSFSSDGRELWRFGRRGGGPGEFQGVEDIIVDRSGDILAVDNANRRVTRINEAGEVIASIAIPKETVIRRLLPQTGGADIAYITMGATLWETATSGRRTNQAGLPREISFGASIVGEALTHAAGSGALIAYRWSSSVVQLDSSGAVRRVIPGVERVEFPRPVVTATRIPDMGAARVTRVDPAAVEASRSIAYHRERIYVLFGGQSRDAGRIVDVYRADTGAYERSLRLPVTPSSFAILPDGRFVTLETNFVPQIRIWTVR